MIIFSDRKAAGAQLADALAHHRGTPQVLVIALTRSAVPVAFEVAQRAGTPLLLFSESGMLKLSGQTVVVVADGLVSSADMLAALTRLHRQSASSLVAAFPVAAPGVVQSLSGAADDVVCLVSSERFGDTCLWYGDDAPVQPMLSVRERRLAERQAGGSPRQLSRRAQPAPGRS